ncbi:MAG: FadR family transcriptional regulator [Streptosporangiales bacterium]|nr:FadR family transcriptional regulator [Streptosporangiales bacterium]MBO0891251.1 FadR family transcriptional regulator [Acidothermales bacterium]
MSAYPQRGMHGAAVNEIGRRILAGQLEPGSILTIEDLEHEFSASRTVIREALRVLAAKGLVDARPKRGTFVRPRDDWSLLDPDVLRWQFERPVDSHQFFDNLAEVRAIVEPAGARLAAARRTDEDLAELADSLAASAEPAASPEEVVAADIRFHRALLFATHNELLQRMEIVIETGLRARDLLVHGKGTWADAVPAHRAVLDAVAGRDEDVAQQAMGALLEQASRDFAALGDGGGSGGGGVVGHGGGRA